MSLSLYIHVTVRSFNVDRVRGWPLTGLTSISPLLQCLPQEHFPKWNFHDLWISRSLYAKKLFILKTNKQTNKSSGLYEFFRCLEVGMLCWCPHNREETIFFWTPCWTFYYWVVLLLKVGVDQMEDRWVCSLGGCGTLAPWIDFLGSQMYSMFIMCRVGSHLPPINQHLPRHHHRVTVRMNRNTLLYLFQQLLNVIISWAWHKQLQLKIQAYNKIQGHIFLRSFGKDRWRSETSKSLVWNCPDCPDISILVQPSLCLF